jgi:hypothetical protein
MDIELHEPEALSGFGSDRRAARQNLGVRRPSLDRRRRIYRQSAMPASRMVARSLRLSIMLCQLLHG